MPKEVIITPKCNVTPFKVDKGDSVTFKNNGTHDVEIRFTDSSPERYPMEPKPYTVPAKSKGEDGKEAFKVTGQVGQYDFVIYDIIDKKVCGPDEDLTPRMVIK